MDGTALEVLRGIETGGDRDGAPHRCVRRGFGEGASDGALKEDEQTLVPGRTVVVDQVTVEGDDRLAVDVQDLGQILEEGLELLSGDGSALPGSFGPTDGPAILWSRSIRQQGSFDDEALAHQRAKEALSRGDVQVAAVGQLL